MAYFVEDDKSLLTNVGSKAPHDEVTKEMCGHNDNKTLDYLADKGILYKAKVNRPAEDEAKAEKAAKAKPPVGDNTAKSGGGTNPGGNE